LEQYLIKKYELSEYEAKMKVKHDFEKIKEEFEKNK